MNRSLKPNFYTYSNLIFPLSRVTTVCMLTDRCFLFAINNGIRYIKRTLILFLVLFTYINTNKSGLCINQRNTILCVIKQRQ